MTISTSSMEGLDLNLNGSWSTRLSLELRMLKMNLTGGLGGKQPISLCDWILKRLNKAGDLSRR